MKIRPFSPKLQQAQQAQQQNWQDQLPQRGFSALELMIVIVIVAVLATVALPSYTSYVIRANRTDAMETLNQILSQQQRYVLRKRTYTTDLRLLGYSAASIESNGGLYRISAKPCADGASLNRCVNLVALPFDGRRQARDGAITINTRGQKTWNGKAGWYHREVGS